MGLYPYNTTTRRSTSRVPIMNKNNIAGDADITGSLATKLDMLAKSTCIDMGAVCYKASQYRQSGKSSSMRQRYRRNSLKRCKKVRGVGQIDDSLLDDCYNSQTKCILSKISDWSFNIFALEKATNGRALFHVIIKLFQHHNLINHFNLDFVKLMTFATLAEEGYRNNPYHNSTHAADVAQAMHCYISQGKIAKHLTPTEILISLVSAITHDLDHPGVNQKFMIDTNNHLANLYENESVLEKHHWRSAIALLHQTGLFDHLSESVREQIEIEMKSLILATDMSKQQKFFDVLKQRVAENSLDMTVYEDRHFILQISLKCADISNPCRRWEVCKSWSEKVCMEFFRQGDLERDLQLQISPLCDRFTNTIPDIQTGFIKYCVEPLFTEFENYLFPSSMLSEQLTNLRANYQEWESRKAIPVAVRPTKLELPLTIDTIPSDIPSPTPSEDIPSPTPSDNIPSPTSSEFCDNSFQEENDVVGLLARRRSLPVVLLENKNLLSRRPSLPDGPQIKTSDTKNLLELFASNLSQSRNNSVCNENDKIILSEILGDLFLSQSMR